MSSRVQRSGTEGSEPFAVIPAEAGIQPPRIVILNLFQDLISIKPGIQYSVIPASEPESHGLYALHFPHFRVP
jgi:hypothetical protein